MLVRGLARFGWDELLEEQRRGVGVQVTDRHGLVRVVLSDDLTLISSKTGGGVLLRALSRCLSRAGLGKKVRF